MVSLKGKRIFVVGGSDGVGFGVVQLALQEGAHVILGSSKDAKVSAAVERARQLLSQGGSVEGVVINSTDEANVKEVCERVGEVDHVVYTAGDSPKKLATENFKTISLDDYRGVLDLRFWGGMNVARHAKIKASVESSLTFTSGGGQEKPAVNWHLSLSPHGTLHTTAKALALDLNPVRVNVVAPGGFKGGLWDGIFGDNLEAKENAYKQMAADTIAKRVAEAVDVAEAYVFMMKCNYVTGQTIFVDGGSFIL